MTSKKILLFLWLTLPLSGMAQIKNGKMLVLIKDPDRKPLLFEEYILKVEIYSIEKVQYQLFKNYIEIVYTNTGERLLENLPAGKYLLTARNDRTLSTGKVEVFFNPRRKPVKVPIIMPSAKSR